MKRSTMALALVCAISALVIAAEPVKRDFESDAIGSPPAGFDFGRTGSGPEGKWVVRVEKGGTSNHVLVQESADKTDYRFPVAVLKEGAYRDVVLSVRARLCPERSTRASASSGGTETPTTTTSRAATRSRTTAGSITS